jgi:hypothetical protein
MARVLLHVIIATADMVECCAGAVKISHSCSTLEELKDLVADALCDELEVFQTLKKTNEMYIAVPLDVTCDCLGIVCERSTSARRPGSEVRHCATERRHQWRKVRYLMSAFGFEVDSE